MSDEEVRCPFCGGVHSVPLGEPDSMFAGIPILTCSRIPPDHFYEDVEFSTGPRGRLHRLELDE